MLLLRLSPKARSGRLRRRVYAWSLLTPVHGAARLSCRITLGRSKVRAIPSLLSEIIDCNHDIVCRVRRGYQTCRNARAVGLGQQPFRLGQGFGSFFLSISHRDRRHLPLVRGRSDQPFSNGLALFRPMHCQCRRGCRRLPFFLRLALRCGFLANGLRGNQKED